MKQFLSNMLSSQSDVSSKRFISFLTVLIIYAVTFVVIFTGKSVPEFVFNGLKDIAMIGISAIAAEKILGKFTNSTEQEK